MVSNLPSTKMAWFWTDAVELFLYVNFRSQENRSAIQFRKNLIHAARDIQINVFPYARSLDAAHIGLHNNSVLSNIEQGAVLEGNVEPGLGYKGPATGASGSVHKVFIQEGPGFPGPIRLRKHRTGKSYAKKQTKDSFHIKKDKKSPSCVGRTLRDNQ